MNKKFNAKELWEIIIRWLPIDEGEVVHSKTKTKHVFVKQSELFFYSVKNIAEALGMKQALEQEELFGKFETIEELYLYYYIRVNGFEGIVEKIKGEQKGDPFIFARNVLLDTRNTIGHYVGKVTDPKDKKELIQLLKIKLVLDELRLLTFEGQAPVGLEDEEEKEDFLPNFEEEEVLEAPQFEEEDFLPNFEEELTPADSVEMLPELKNKKEVFDVSRTDYYAASILFRDSALKKDIEIKGLKEVKRMDESIVEFAKQLAKKLRLAKNEE